MAATILQLVGSPTDLFFCELSELYARGCLDALADDRRFEFVIAHVAPDGAWRFPDTLDSGALDAAQPMAFAAAMTHLAALNIDAALPQMFCEAGLTDYRALLDVLGLAFIGNRATQMAVTADKRMAKALVAAAGVATPASQRLGAHDSITLALPLVVKPNRADNSDGISLVRTHNEIAPALAEARAYGDDVLAETYIELGREVRCGVIERDGELVGLPVEEYNVDTRTRPVRRRADKLKRGDNNTLGLAAKNAASSWIVDANDPIVADVWAAAFACYRALGLRHYGLFDFRIDAAGTPWFLEAGPYCSFSPQSVVVTMMRAAGEPLDAFFVRALADWAGIAMD